MAYTEQLESLFFFFFFKFLCVTVSIFILYNFSSFILFDCDMISYTSHGNVHGTNVNCEVL